MQTRVAAAAATCAALLHRKTCSQTPVGPIGATIRLCSRTFSRLTAEMLLLTQTKLLLEVSYDSSSYLAVLLEPGGIISSSTCPCNLMGPVIDVLQHLSARVHRSVYVDG